ncbi:hypothetical protein Droror1_Dr00019968 [Drosera rotundifolia]
MEILTEIAEKEIDAISEETKSKKARPLNSDEQEQNPSKENPDPVTKDLSMLLVVNAQLKEEEKKVGKLTKELNIVKLQLKKIQDISLLSSSQT